MGVDSSGDDGLSLDDDNDDEEDRKGEEVTEDEEECLVEILVGNEFLGMRHLLGWMVAHNNLPLNFLWVPL